MVFPKHDVYLTTAYWVIFPWPSVEAEWGRDVEENWVILHQMKSAIPSLGRGRAKRHQEDGESFLSQNDCRDGNCPLLNMNPRMAIGSADPRLLPHLKTIIYSHLPQGLCDRDLINAHQERIFHFIISSLFIFTLLRLKP